MLVEAEQVILLCGLAFNRANDFTEDEYWCSFKRFEYFILEEIVLYIILISANFANDHSGRGSQMKGRKYFNKSLDRQFIGLHQASETSKWRALCPYQLSIHYENFFIA